MEYLPYYILWVEIKMLQFREWLSIQLIDLGLMVCPYEEIRMATRVGISIGMDLYLKDADESE